MAFQTRLFVGNLPEKSVEKDVHNAFSKFGEIVNLELKQKPGDDAGKKFAFVTLSASNYDVESCIKYFSHEDFNHSRLYVTKARESFLERLQRERQQTQNDKIEKPLELPSQNPIIKLGDKLNPRKRKNIDISQDSDLQLHQTSKTYRKKSFDVNSIEPQEKGPYLPEKALPKKDSKKDNSDLKRLESMKRKRQEFKEKQNIIKSGLISVDKGQKPNKKVVFSDSEENDSKKSSNSKVLQRKDKKTLFDDDESGDEVNFEIKEQFEGKKGQKVLDLQSRYKSDKRFVLDERFLEDDDAEETNQKNELANDNEDIQLQQKDEKSKQLNILQDIFGVTLKTHSSDPNPNKKIKNKPGMLRFDPSHPEHAKHLAPIEEMKKDTSKKSKKKKSKDQEEEEVQKVEQEPEKVEVSKEQFYKVTDALKEAITQPNTFSLRSLFAKDKEPEQEDVEQDTGYIPLNKETKKAKVFNPLDPGERNPFKYDSSDSEDEEEKPQEKHQKDLPAEPQTPKAVWKENLFFSKSDYRFKEALAFFSKTHDSEEQKERRELKSLMKKRIYNKERKNQMFQKKIGGKRKSMKKSFRKHK